eukprot:219140-Pelagomonas_calceolata.AAC.11
MQVIIAHDSSASHASSYQALMDAVHAPFAPSKAVIHIDVSDPACKAFWQDYNPAAWDMVQAHFQKQECESWLNNVPSVVHWAPGLRYREGKAFKDGTCSCDLLTSSYEDLCCSFAAPLLLLICNSNSNHNCHSCMCSDPYSLHLPELHLPVHSSGSE